LTPVAGVGIAGTPPGDVEVWVAVAGVAGVGAWVSAGRMTV